MVSPFRLPPQSEPPLSPRKTLPTMYDLPSELPGEPGLPDEFHPLQAELLRKTFQPRNVNPDHIFSAIDLNLYYDLTHPLWYKRPDWFAVVGISRLYDDEDLRLSYVIWQEQISPLIVVELLSPGTEDEDLGQTQRQPGKPPTKWVVYEQILRVSYYVVFSRYTNEMQPFHLVGDRYQRVELTNGRLLIPSVELSLGVWQGEYAMLDRSWLRWMTLDGELILNAEERAVAAQQQAVAAEERAEQLAQRLRELGI
ncbi:MAG: Uma2 family endonuclease, partial [Cyanobacteriota bacterium]|nr:Uma2 family endonuclease [Cyanobacteriota bacterium]